MKRLISFLCAAALPACALTSSDDAECVGGKCDGSGNSCPDKRYGNGVCDPELSCAVPDIDCFQTFQTDEEAAAWYGEFEALLAMESGGEPRNILPTSHPDFARTRALLDRGWEAFRANRPVGLLGNARPGLVLVEDEAVNAFVAPTTDLQRAGFSVMVHSSLLSAEGFSEDAMLGLMMHELQHAVGLHVLGDVKEKYKRYYVADGSEPIGRLQPDNARVRAAMTEWIAAGGEIGSFTNAELGGMPLSGDLNRVFVTVLQSGLETNPAACEQSRDAFNALGSELQLDPISGALTAPASLKTRVDAAFAQLQSQCLAGFAMSFVDVVAQIAGATPEAIEATLTDEDKQLVAGKHVVEAIRLLGEHRRAKMRSIEEAFARDTGHPWSAVRYFTTEEDADDISVPVLRNAGLKPAGLGDFLAKLLSDEAACRAIITAGRVPHYGVDLVDDHHGTCWRVYHIDAYAQETAKRRAEAMPVFVDAPPPKRLLPPRLRDVVMY